MTPYEYDTVRQTLEHIWTKLSKAKGCETALNIVAMETTRLDLEYNPLTPTKEM